MAEEWRQIQGYGGRYIVSNRGRVASSYNHGKCARNRDADMPDGFYLLKLNRNTAGYDQVSLYADGKRKIRTVHRLVMEAFVGESDKDINHKNEVKTDNRMENLEYVTSSINHVHSVGRPIERFDLESGKVRAIYSSILAAKEDGHSASGILATCAGNSDSYHGFGWRYHDEFR